MKYFRVGLIFIALLVGGFPNFLRAQDTIDVVANLDRARNGHIILSFNLVNCSNKHISIEYGNLPWNQTYTTIVPYLGFGFFAREIPRIMSPMDFPSHLVHFGSHENKKGQIDLNIAFPTLDRAKDYSNLIVFWGYQFHGVNATPESTFGGMLKLAQSDNHPSCKTR